MTVSEPILNLSWPETSTQILIATHITEREFYKLYNKSPTPRHRPHTTIARIFKHQFGAIGTVPGNQPFGGENYHVNKFGVSFCNQAARSLVLWLIGGVFSIWKIVQVSVIKLGSLSNQFWTDIGLLAPNPTDNPSPDLPHLQGTDATQNDFKF